MAPVKAKSNFNAMVIYRKNWQEAVLGLWFFLTPGGSRSNTAGTHIDHVFPISWRRLAISMKKSIVFLSAAASPLAGPRQVSAEQAVQRFLKKMRNF